MYDAIIVGARCAGSAVAMLLARRGYRVLLVDRATFPSDTISGHFILHPGTRKLAEWGLLENVLASNCPPVSRYASDLGDFTLSGEVPTSDCVPACVGPRRTVLDKILVDAAVEAGAELMEAFVVTEVLIDGERVTGIRGRTQNGTTVAERAHIVIGADGKRSRIAELVQAPRYLEQPSLTCWYGTYWSDFPSAGLEIHWRPRRVVFSFPTNDGLTLAFVGWPHREFHQFRSDIEGNYRKTLQMIPALAERLQRARRAERFLGMADVPNFFRKPYGPGWALVGDAGHHKDPTLARGISDAFCDAALLAAAVDDGLAGRQAMPEALAQYERLRNERAIPDNELNLQMAHLEAWDAPEVLRLRAALRDNPADTSRFLAVSAKVIPREEFFAPENIQRIIMQAQPPQARLASLPAWLSSRSRESAAPPATTSSAT
jgi:flavin-dependent dehydrogenase